MQRLHHAHEAFCCCRKNKVVLDLPVEAAPDLVKEEAPAGKVIPNSLVGGVRAF